MKTCSSVSKAVARSRPACRLSFLVRPCRLKHAVLTAFVAACVGCCSLSAQTKKADVDGDGVIDKVELRGLVVEVVSGRTQSVQRYSYNRNVAALSLSATVDLDAVPGAEIVLLITRPDHYTRVIEILHPASGLRRTYEFPKTVALSISYIEDMDGLPGKELVLLITHTMTLDRSVAIIHPISGDVSHYQFPGVVAVSLSAVEDLDGITGRELVVMSTKKGYLDREVALVSDMTRSVSRFDFPGLTAMSIAAVTDVDGQPGGDVIVLATGPGTRKRRVEVLHLNPPRRSVYDFGELTSLSLEVQELDAVAGAEIVVDWRAAQRTGRDVIFDARGARTPVVDDSNKAPIATITIPPAVFAASGAVRTARGNPLAGVRMVFSRTSGLGALPTPVITDASGQWQQTGFSSGTIYRVQAEQSGKVFSPAYLQFGVGNAAGKNFVLPASAGKTQVEGFIADLGDVSILASKEGVRISWHSGDGILEASDSVSGPWRRLDSGAIANANGSQSILIQPEDRGCRFFRLAPLERVPER